MKVASIDGSSALPPSDTPAEGGGRAIDIDQLAEKVAALIQQKLEVRTAQRDSTLPSEITVQESVTPTVDIQSIIMKLSVPLVGWQNLATCFPSNQAASL
jgi:hypothetical protein